jgi:hypothetical protein
MPEAQSSASRTFHRAITGAVMLSAAALASTNGSAQSQPASVSFTPQECKYITNLLVDEMRHYSSRENDPNSKMTATLVRSAKEFIGRDSLCEGQVINWTTGGDKAILSAVALRIDNLEKHKKIPNNDLSGRFISIIGKTAQSASLEPAPR